MKKTFDRYLSLVERALEQSLPAPSEGELTAPVMESMRYSVFVGGQTDPPSDGTGFLPAVRGENSKKPFPLPALWKWSTPTP